LVACANAGTPHSNGSQFFFTLDRCEWIDKKSTIFGKVTGDSIYNLLRLGEVDTDKDDRPLQPPKILSVEVISSYMSQTIMMLLLSVDVYLYRLFLCTCYKVLWNPFDDIVP